MLCTVARLFCGLPWLQVMFSDYGSGSPSSGVDMDAAVAVAILPEHRLSVLQSSPLHMGVGVYGCETWNPLWGNGIGVFALGASIATLLCLGVMLLWAMTWIVSDEVLCDRCMQCWSRGDRCFCVLCWGCRRAL